ncbi:hypothetical protein ACJRO7_001559 [Eucalyptus globulus]|uniref:Uncharacterized protein n=1 Tax=Eucalyptus globulus TaxID=34317 RepID=A0ABD3LRC5_EUCGL
MAISVIRSSDSFVKPSEKTPSHLLDLSAIDRIPVLRCNTRTLHVFTHGPDAARVIKEALSKALVPYYPIAGRLVESVAGELQIDCSEEGVRFVEATADCTLESVNYFEDVMSIPYDELLPGELQEPESREPLVQMQVTRFVCGGFVIGLIFCHSICDGLGAARFLNALGEFARGLERPTIEPVWYRHFFPAPTPQSRSDNVSPPPLPIPPPPLPNYQLQHANIDIPLEDINKLKQIFRKSTGRNCSTFEAVAASFWSSRTQVISLNPQTEVCLVFFANCRQLLDPPLPDGFYGNCFFPVTVKASSELLQEGSFTDAVKIIQEAKEKLPSEFEKFKKGDPLEHGADPFTPPLGYTTLFLSEWGRLGFNRVDYGWGPPAHIVPVQGSSTIPAGIVGSLPLPREGVRLMTWCIEEAHRRPLLDQMAKLFQCYSEHDP